MYFSVNNISFDFDRFFNMSACIVIGYNYDNVHNFMCTKEIEMSSMPKLELSYRPRILSNSNLLLSYIDDV